MAHWTPLSDVDEVRMLGKSKQFPPLLVYAANYSAMSPYPRRFVYASCPAESADGHRCLLSLEFGSKCGHFQPGELAWRFQILIFDAVNAYPPMKVLLWNAASILLSSTPSEFHTLTKSEQLRRVHNVTHRAPKLQVTLEVKNGEVHCQHLSFVHAGIPLTPAKAMVASTSSLAPPKSAKKILHDLVEQLSSCDLED